MGLVEDLWEDYAPLFGIGGILIVFVIILVMAYKQENAELARACAEATAAVRTSADKIAAIRICYDLDRPKTTVITQPVYMR